MSFNEDLAGKNGVEKLNISGNKWAWVLPEKDSWREMVAYAHNKNWVWIHPDYKNGQDNKKKNKKR